MAAARATARGRARRRRRRGDARTPSAPTTGCSQGTRGVLEGYSRGTRGQAARAATRLCLRGEPMQLRPRAWEGVSPFLRGPRADGHGGEPIQASVGAQPESVGPSAVSTPWVRRGYSTAGRSACRRRRSQTRKANSGWSRYSRGTLGTHRGTLGNHRVIRGLAGYFEYSQGYSERSGWRRQVPSTRAARRRPAARAFRCVCVCVRTRGTHSQASWLTEKRALGTHGVLGVLGVLTRLSTHSQASWLAEKRAMSHALAELTEQKSALNESVSTQSTPEYRRVSTQSTPCAVSTRVTQRLVCSSARSYNSQRSL
jgi:hypothetical protein